MSAPFDQVDRDLLERLQEGIAVEHRPYAPLAAETGLNEQQIVDRIKAWLDAGLLSRFGPLLNAERMGGAFCLCAMAVPDDRFDAVAEIVNRFDEVAHNYQREHRYNMWFVLACETPTGIYETAKLIEKATGLEVNLFPKQVEYFVEFKVPA